MMAKSYLERSKRKNSCDMPIATRYGSICLMIFALLVNQGWAQKVEAQGKQETLPRVFLLDAKHLQLTKQRLREGDKSLSPAFAKLESEAQKALTLEPLSVVNKAAAPPSGDKHDYISQAPYFWPNPETRDGLPYIRHDGERNPEINKYPDHAIQDKMIGAVETLALAYYFKGNEAYAAKAAQVLRAWYLDAATRMNPHLQFAQAIPGVNTGRGIGLIETRGLARLVDAVGLLAGSKAWTDADQCGLQEWFATFLQWMIESKNGRDEAASKNNHGTYYDVQTASFALFVGKKELAASILQTSRQKRIALQVEPDGRQPLELERTKSWGYSLMNLEGLMELAKLGGQLGVDLWNYQTADGRSIRKALDYLAPYALGERKWAHQQLGEWEPQTLYPLMRQAALHYQDPAYRTLMAKVPKPDPADRKNLLQKTEPVQETKASAAQTQRRADRRGPDFATERKAAKAESLGLDARGVIEKWLNKEEQFT
jgi:hypothetical protein